MLCIIITQNLSSDKTNANKNGSGKAGLQTKIQAEIKHEKMQSPLRVGTLRNTVKPVLNWANVCSPGHTSDTSTNYDSFLN